MNGYIPKHQVNPHGGSIISYVAERIFPFIRDAMLRFRMGEEKWSVSSLTNYKMVRSMAWLYHNTKDAVSEFSKKYKSEKYSKF